MEKLAVGDLQLELRRSKRRRTLQITVDRGGELVISAPENCPRTELANFVREKRVWIYTKLAEKEPVSGHAPAKNYVSGEGFTYLGRSYRLQLVEKQDQAVKLEAGRFKLHRGEVTNGRDHMIAWYVRHAQPWIEKRVDRFAPRVGAHPAGTIVRDLGYRWGSCGQGGKLYFHWRTIQLSPRLVDYVVVHELIHLLEPNHTPAFWRRVERILPDCWTLKHELAQRGSETAGV